MSETSEHFYHSLSTGNHVVGLADNSSYMIVHYMWCSRKDKYFDFKHYLSIISIIQAIHPDELIFHYVHKPKFISKNPSWFDVLQRDLTILSIDPEPSGNLCRMFLKGKLTDIKISDEQMMGVFIQDGVVLSNISRKFVLGRLKQSCNDFHCQMQPRKPQTRRIVIESSFQSTVSDDINTIKCSVIDDINEFNEMSPCVQYTRSISVEDILTNKNAFSSLARKTLYGREHPVEVIASKKNPIPLHGHIISENFSELTSVSIHSALQNSGLETIFFHGKYIDPKILKELQTQKTKFVFVEVDDRYFPTSSSSKLLYSLNVLLSYGGVFFNENVIWLNKISSSDELRNYDTVAIQSSNEISFDILLAKPGAKFLQKLIPLIKQISADVSREEDEYTKAAYHLYQQQPNTVFFSNKLSEFLQCDSEICLPEVRHLKNSDSLTVSIHVDSRNENFAASQLKKHMH